MGTKSVNLTVPSGTNRAIDSHPNLREDSKTYVGRLIRARPCTREIDTESLHGNRWRLNNGMALGTAGTIGAVRQLYSKK